MQTESQKQKAQPSSVEIAPNRNQALAWIDKEIQRFASEHSGKRPTLVRVGGKLFAAAFPNKHYPHRVGTIFDVCIFPREDMGDFEIKTVGVPE